MREIKFRAKATQDYFTSADAVQKGDWVEGYYYFCRNRMSGIIVTELEAESGGVGSGIVQVEIQVDHETRGEYTNLKDKSNREIYEGDIVKAYRQARREDLKDEFRKGVSIGEVRYEPPGFFIWMPREVKLNWIEFDAFAEPYEVIGNIYENPELLK